jgi:hypothetical protein
MARQMDQVPTGKITWATFCGTNSDGAFKFVPKKWHRVRFFGLVTSDFRHNVPTKTGKTYPEYCHAYDTDNDTFLDDRTVCECCIREVPGSSRYFMNLIDIEAEENKPAKLPQNWSPVRYAEVSKSLFEKLQGLTGPNRQFPITHPEHGAIVQIQYNPDAEAANMYACTLDERDVALTEEQLQYKIIQVYQDRTRKVIEGDGVNPPQYQYIRCVNPLSEMRKSLDRNLVGPQFAKKLPSLDEVDVPGVEEKLVSRAATEMPVQKAPDLLRSNGNGNGKPAEEEAPQETAVVDDPSLAHENCPKSYGDFAASNVCFRECKVRRGCREATARNKAAKTQKTEADDDAV